MHFKVKNIKGHKYLYIIKNDRINGKVVQTIQKYVGTAESLYEMLTSNKSIRIASFSFGKPAALIKAAEEVGLMESIDKHFNRKKIDGLTAAQYLLMIIIGRSEHELSRNVLGSYFNKSALKFIWSPKHALSSQNFLNYMARLDEDMIQSIELDISRAMIALGLRPTRLIFDTTNFYTHIDHGEDLPQKGNSKEKRFDKNLIGVGLTTSDHNIPFQSITYPANKNDAKLFSNLIDSICERLKNINIQTRDLVIVFDRGMNSAENIKKAVEQMHIVGSLPSSMCKEAFNIPVSEFHEKWENASGNTIMAYPITGNWYETEFRGVIKYSEATRAKQLNDWASNKSKILTIVEEIRSKLERSGKGRKITAKGLINRIADAIPKQYRGLFDYKIIEIDGKLKLDFKLDEARETEHILAMGKTVIFTDQKDSTLREIVETYDARNQIENDIAWLKDKLLIPLKPVYVRKDSQIRAHVFLCVTGLLLYNYLLYVIQDSSLSIKQLAEHLDQMRLGLVRDNDGKGKGKMKAAFVIEEMNKSTAEVFGKLQLGKYIPG